MNTYQPAEMKKWIKQVICSMPDSREDICYGIPAFYAHKKLVCRFKEDGETLVLYHEDRDEPINANPEVYFITDHYKNYPYVLVRLPLIKREELKLMLIYAWKLRATQKQLKAYELLMSL